MTIDITFWPCSTAAWTFVVATGPAQPVIVRLGFTDPARRLFVRLTVASGAGRVLVRSHGGGVDVQLPGDQPRRVGQGA
jgi:hypothetical protein